MELHIAPTPKILLAAQPRVTRCFTGSQDSYTERVAMLARDA